MRMYFSYAWASLWHDRQRYLPGVLGVAFSALLISLQCGMLMGMFTFASLPIDRARADIWLGGPSIQTADLSRPISEHQLVRLAAQPEIDQAEIYLQQRSYWIKPDGNQELCLVIGSRLEDNSLGAVRELGPGLRRRLNQRGAVVIDQSDLGRLGVKRIGDRGEIHGQQAEVVGIIHGFRGTSGAHIFCSVDTAQALLALPADNNVSYVLGRCHDPAKSRVVVERLRAAYPQLSAFTANELSYRSRMYWLVKTKGGIALGYGAILGLLVGAVVTGQTLYAATSSQLREYAVLWALGIPVRRMSAIVMAEALWIGCAGILTALPVTFVLAQIATWLGALVLLPYWILGSSALLTMTMALVSGLAGLRSLKQIEPAILLR